jgi:hypothetical protein
MNILKSIGSGLKKALVSTGKFIVKEKPVIDVAAETGAAIVGVVDPSAAPIATEIASIEKAITVPKQ